MSRVLVAAAGADWRLVAACSETTRYSVLGGLVLFTTAMAVIAVFAAVAVAADGSMLVAGPLAALWGFGIFQIDRWVVSTHLESDGLFPRIRLLLTRLLVTVPMALLISWFAMLAVAGQEIDEKLAAGRAAAAAETSAAVRGNSDLARQRDAATAEEESLRRTRDEATAQVATLQREYDQECGGTGGSRIRGCGPIAAGKRSRLDAAIAIQAAAQDRLDSRGAELDREIRRIEQEIESAVADQSAPALANDGLFARREALSQVREDDEGVDDLYRLIEAVLVLVDAAPALAKAFSPVSTVDDATRSRRRRRRELLQLGDGIVVRSPAVAAAFAHAAEQEAEVIRAQADARRREALRRIHEESVPVHGRRARAARRRLRLRPVLAILLVPALIGAGLVAFRDRTGTVPGASPELTPGVLAEARVAPGRRTELGVPGRIAVDVPAGAVADDGVLRISEIASGAAVRGSDGAGAPVNVELVGTSIARPVRLRFPAGGGPSGHEPEIRFYDTKRSAWVAVPSSYDAASGEVVASVTHFSDWSSGLWCLECVADLAWQGVGRLAGKRTGPPSCDGRQPGWVRELVHTAMRSSPLRACVESEGETAVLRIVNNRGYPVVLRSNTRFRWAALIGQVVPVNDLAHELAPAAFAGGAEDFVLLPGLAEVAIGIDPPPNGVLSLRAEVSSAMLGLAVLEQVVAEVGTSERVRSGLMRLVLSCYATVLQPATDLDGGLVQFLTDVAACAAGIVQDRHLLGSLTTGSLSDGEVVSAQKAIKAFKYREWAGYATVLGDWTADRSSGVDSVVALRVHDRSEPEPEPEPEPRPEPQPEPAPEPQPQPAPEPQPQPEPAPAPQPEPAPEPQPGPEPQPRPEPEPQPQPEPQPEPRVIVSKGTPAQVAGCVVDACARVRVELVGFPAGARTVSCHTPMDGAVPFWTYVTGEAVSEQCVFGYPGQEVYVVVDGVTSPALVWPADPHAA